MTLFRTFIIIGFIFLGFAVEGQDKTMNAILKMPDDTVKVNELRKASGKFVSDEKYDSALFINQTALQLSNKIKSNEKIIQCYEDKYRIFYLQEKDSLALNVLTDAIEKCKNLNYSHGLVTLNRLFSGYYAERGEWHPALKYSEDALLSCDSVKEASLYAAILSNMGLYNNFMGNSNDGINAFLRGLKIAETAKDSFRISAIYNNISNLYNNIGDAAKSKEYCYKSIEIKKTIDPAGLYFPYQNLGYVYNTISINYDSSLYYYHLAVPLAMAAGNKKQLGNIYQNLSAIFEKLGMQDSAMTYAHNALDIHLSTGNKDGTAAALNALGVRYRQRGERTNNKSDFIKSLDFFNRALVYAEESGPLWKQNTYRNLSDFYKVMGDFKNAYKYELLYSEIKDTLLNEEIVNNTSKLEAKYQNEKNQNEINQLTAEKEISRVTMARQHTTNYSLAAIAFLIFASSVVIFRNVQKKRGAEQQVAILEKQNAIETMRSKIASDVHDDMGAGLTKMGLFSEQLMKSKTVTENEKQLLEKISLQSKEAIDGMREIIWASNPANDNLKSMLGFMRQYIDRFFDGTDIRPVINFPHDIGEIVLHPEVRRNLFLILKESLNNAVKYSGSDKVDIDFRNENENFNLDIKDYGKGMDDKPKNDFSNGLRNMEMRAQQIQSAFQLITEPGKGVHIVVAGKLY